jgi:hypothetical protein
MDFVTKNDVLQNGACAKTPLTKNGATTYGNWSRDNQIPKFKKPRARRYFCHPTTFDLTVPKIETFK